MFKALIDFYDVDTKTSYKIGDIVPWGEARGDEYTSKGVVEIADVVVEVVRKMTSPARMAVEKYGLDISMVEGTGAGGRITLGDVRREHNGNN